MWVVWLYFVFKGTVVLLLLIVFLLFISVSLQTRDRIGTGGSVVDCRGLLENEG